MMDARTLTLALQGTWRGPSGQAPCPICQPERRPNQQALSIRDRADGAGLLLHCHKGDCSFVEILEALRAAGLAVQRQSGSGFVAHEVPRPTPGDTEPDRRRAAQAQACWQEAQPIQGTRAEAYLRRRGITCALPPSLRYHPACWHPSGWRLPALVAHVEGADDFAIHRTFLRVDEGRKAEVQPAKAMLGAVAGGAVRLVAMPLEPDVPLVVTEGIETGLSMASGLLCGPATVWAALSTSGMRALRLPDRPAQLIIAADGDRAGREAAYALAIRAQGLGWRVSLMPAPEGRDWNDVLIGKGVSQ